MASAAGAELAHAAMDLASIDEAGCVASRERRQGFRSLRRLSDTKGEPSAVHVARSETDARTIKTALLRGREQQKAALPPTTAQTRRIFLNRSSFSEHKASRTIPAA